MGMLEDHCDVCDHATRRHFLAGAARSLLGVGTLPLLWRLAAAQDAGAVPLRPATARNVIYLFMSGGMSHLDTLDPKPGSEAQGPVQAIPTNVDGLLLSEHLPNLAKRADRVAIVSSMFSNQGAHEQGRYFMHTGYALRGTVRHPSMGAWLTRLGGKANPTLPGHVLIGGGVDASAGFLESQYGPLPIGDPAAGLTNASRAAGVEEAVQARRLERLRKLNQGFRDKYDVKKVRAYDKMYDEALRLMSSKDMAAFDVSQEPASLRQAYGNDRFGQGCLLARRLVEHQVRFVEVVDGGWDTHNDNFETLSEKVPRIDQALSALLADLEVRGLLDDTLVVLATEFGRTPRIRTERNNGRDHHPKAFSCLLAGGGIKGGIRHGRTDASGDSVVEDRVTVPDFNATIAYALGLPLDYKVTSPSGRPFTVADKGKPVTRLFA